MKILLLSAYDAASHRQWYQSLQQAFTTVEWTVLALPPRYFSWRVRGNSLSWAFSNRQQLEQGYDLLIATSMVDLSALRGFVPALARIPTLVYFHENQFAYPRNARQFISVEPQLLNIYTALAADKVVFNSEYNRRTFLQGAEQLLAKLPDAVPSGLMDLLTASSAVVPVPLADACFQQRQIERQGPLQLLWNHRWEYDKGPDRLLAAVRSLAVSLRSPVRLHIVGQQFRQVPEAFAAIAALIDSSEHLLAGHWGFIADPTEYRQLLGQADVVVSTAEHDFQGLAVLEAVAAGCVPLVPDRLCYSEWFGAEYRYPSVLENMDLESQGLVSKVRQLQAQKAAGQLRAPAVAPFKLSALRTSYDALFAEVLAAADQNPRGHCPGE